LNSAAELHPIFSCLLDDFPSEDIFLHRYFENPTATKFGKRKPEGPIREKELHMFLNASIMIRRLKADAVSDKTKLSRI